MPWESTSTVVPNVAFEALFTSAALCPLDPPLGDEVVPAGAALACEFEPELLEVLELLPHAANVSDAASGRARIFSAECIWDSFSRNASERMERFAGTAGLSYRTPHC
jgi:hypothetical protein